LKLIDPLTLLSFTTAITYRHVDFIDCECKLLYGLELTTGVYRTFVTWLHTALSSQVPDDYIILPETVLAKLDKINVHKTPGPDDIPN